MNLPKAEDARPGVPVDPDREGDLAPDGRRQPASPAQAPPALPRLGVSAGILGVPLAAWFVLPLFGVIIGTAEVAAVLTVVFTALYGSDENSDRAFRLLCWSLNRPEPPAGASRRIRARADP